MSPACCVEDCLCQTYTSSKAHMFAFNVKSWRAVHWALCSIKDSREFNGKRDKTLAFVWVKQPELECNELDATIRTSQPSDGGRIKDRQILHHHTLKGMISVACPRRMSIIMHCVTKQRAIECIQRSDEIRNKSIFKNSSILSGRRVRSSTHDPTPSVFAVKNPIFFNVEQFPSPEAILEKVKSIRRCDTANISTFGSKRAIVDLNEHGSNCCIGNGLVSSRI